MESEFGLGLLGVLGGVGGVVEVGERGFFFVGV